jgi:molecular chaperone GrpE (heat shock protein)
MRKAETETEPALEPATTDSQQSLTERMDYLEALFKRRLDLNRESTRAFDALYQELAAARAAVDGLLIMPLARRIFMLIDRLDQEEDSQLAESIADELAEMLYVQGFLQVAVDAGQFDPATQEAVAVATPPGAEDGQIVGYVRRGWLYQGRLVQPALVEVAVPVTEELKSADGPAEGRGDA